MSKIGKINISIPEKVKVILSGSDININDGKEVSIKPKKLDVNSKRLWGMNRSLSLIHI